MQELINKVQELVAFELERANTIHPPKFNSMHEAYAVILEEMDEVKADTSLMYSKTEGLWWAVKHDSNPINKLKDIEGYAMHAAAELIQVSAMCRKARM